MSKEQVESFLGACREQEGKPNDRLRQATGRFLAAARQDPAILAEAASAMPTLAPASAVWLAVTFGSAVEQGAEPDQTAAAVVQLLLSWLPSLPFPEEDEEPLPTPEQATLIDALPFVCQSVVAHLARTPERRAELAGDQQLLERLEMLQGYSYAPLWVHELLVRISGPLIVLHPESKRGLRLRYENVARAFHLFSLLQAAIGTSLPGGRPVDETVAAVARGQSEQRVNDEAWWHYGDPWTRIAHIGASIWAEDSVEAIPLVDDVRVLLLWPPILGSRSWSSSFFGPVLDAAPPNVIVERELSLEECQSWLERLKVEA